LANDKFITAYSVRENLDELKGLVKIGSYLEKRKKFWVKYLSIKMLYGVAFLPNGKALTNNLNQKTSSSHEIVLQSHTFTIHNRNEIANISWLSFARIHVLLIIFQHYFFLLVPFIRTCMCIALSSQAVPSFHTVIHKKNTTLLCPLRLLAYPPSFL
jgi:uncharacterized protein YqhQ